ncbi:MAG: hypothetical protein VW268_11455 [Rhodospirillaceae bacterium]
MVELVTGSGAHRTLSLNAAQQYAAEAQRLAQAEAAQQRRDLLAVGAARLRADPLARGPLDATVPAGDVDARSADRPSRSPQLADLVSDPNEVNRILEETQGVNRRGSDGDRAAQAALLVDAFRRSLFISMIDPGRAMTVLGARDIIKMEDET